MAKKRAKLHMLKLPRGLHRQAARYAEMDGVSLEEWILAAVAQSIGAENAAERVEVTVWQTASTAAQRPQGDE